MTKLTSMPNIGKEIESKLKSVQINTAEELVEIGAKQAFFRLKISASVFGAFIHVGSRHSKRGF